MLVALAGFVATSPVGLLMQRRRRARVPFDPEALPLHERPRRRTATCTGRAAATWRSSTATTSTTSTTAIGTPSMSPATGSTMTSTEPNPGQPGGPRPTPQRQAVLDALDRRRGLPLRAGGPRAARGRRLRRRPGHRLSRPGPVRRPRARRRTPSRGRRGDLPPLLRHPPPSPGLPVVRCDGRGRGSGGGEVDFGDRGRARVLRPLPHAGDRRHLRRLPQGPIASGRRPVPSRPPRPPRSPTPATSAARARQWR